MAAPHPSRAQIIRENQALQAEVAQTYLERNRHFIATQGFAEYEDTFTLPVGTRTFFIVDQVLTNAQGEGEALLTSSIDITERKRTEADLQVALMKYRTLFDAFPLGITVSDATGKIVESNTMAERLLGLGRAEQRQRAIDGIEWQIVRPDGTPMPAEEYASVRALREQCLVENVEMGVRIPRAGRPKMRCAPCSTRRRCCLKRSTIGLKITCKWW